MGWSCCWGWSQIFYHFPSQFQIANIHKKKKENLKKTVLDQNNVIQRKITVPKKIELIFVFCLSLFFLFSGHFLLYCPQILLCLFVPKNEPPFVICPVSWGCRIHWLHLCRGVRPPPITSVLDMTLNNLMLRFQQCWSFGECGVPLHCHRSQVHSGPEW